VLNKTTEDAIAAMSRLAEAYEAGTPLTAAEIADSRGLPKPLVAKLLTILSANDLLRGTPGRHGGYVLARDPSAIRLLDIASCFERIRKPLSCPLGRDNCEHGESRCGLHSELAELDEAFRGFLTRNTLASLQVRPNKPQRKRMKGK
jgi:Rrf2 family protein